MKNVIFIFILSLQISAFATTSDVSKIESLASADDYLGLRIQLIKSYNLPVDYKDWVRIHKLISRIPQVGYDITFAWGRHKKVTNIPANSMSQNIESLIEQAEKQTDNRKYIEAFDSFQQAATLIRSTYKKNIAEENKGIYYWLLHQMARSLYGAGRFDQALEVYSWVPRKYDQFRQVQFEKMWTAYRLDKLDVALGAIISQQSAYYSKYIEPESYLVKLYILQKLCNQKEVNRVVADIDGYLNNIRTKKLSTREWSKNNLNHYALSLLVNVSAEKGRLDIISSKERAEEKKRIIRKLTARFNDDKKRIENDLLKVKGYAQLMKFDVAGELAKMQELPSSGVLSAQGLEYWPTSKNEEWVDEAGQYFYIGKSLCKTTK